MMSQDHPFTNRLIDEKSPYLLQHAHNPIDWYPWGKEAFNRAKKEDRPIFLSIGYAACHWCQMMQKEAFSDEEIASLLNANCINIKVDREELVAVDRLYMKFAQALLGDVLGWPLNIFLTPDLKPFFAKTYVPLENHYGSLGMKELVLKIKSLWEGSSREEMLEQSKRIVDLFIEDKGFFSDSELLVQEDLEANVSTLYQLIDPLYGGIGGVPKFLTPCNVRFMIRHAFKNNSPRALFYVDRTLQKISSGGIYDQIGGGFSRYSVDRKWLIPHFEKMLYDNAQMLQCYIQLWQYTQWPWVEKVVRETLNYMQKELRLPEGIFASSQEADSNGVEGEYYLWSQGEIEDILGFEESQLFCQYFGVTREGNFEGKNILHRPVQLEEFAEKRHLDPHSLNERLEAQRRILSRVRLGRKKPNLDDKVITAWNAHAISAYLQAYQAFSEDEYLQIARRALCFLKDHLFKEGVLYRRWCRGELRFRATLEDYAGLIDVLLLFFQIEANIEDLKWALQLLDRVLEDFSAENEAYYICDHQEEDILVRQVELHDGAEPSGNALLCGVFLTLYQMTLKREYLDRAISILQVMKEYFIYHPVGCYQHLMNQERYLCFDKEPLIVIALNASRDHEQDIRQHLFKYYTRDKVVIWKDKENQEALDEILPWLKEFTVKEEKTTLYMCRQGSCRAPIHSLDAMQKALEDLY